MSATLACWRLGETPWWAALNADLWRTVGEWQPARSERCAVGARREVRR